MREKKVYIPRWHKEGNTRAHLLFERLTLSRTRENRVDLLDYDFLPALSRATRGSSNSARVTMGLRSGALAGEPFVR